jgi:hypothetical protein
MPVPETTVNEDRRAVLWEQHGWRSGKVTAVQSEPQTETAGRAEYDQLGLGVVLPHRSHDVAANRIDTAVRVHDCGAGAKSSIGSKTAESLSTLTCSSR